METCDFLIGPQLFLEMDLLQNPFRQIGAPC